LAHLSGNDGVYPAPLYLSVRRAYGLFQDHRLEPHEQMKIGEFTWMRKSGETYVDRPAYHG